MTLPTKIIDAFGHNAGPDFINAIPETAATPGAASFDQGFPPLTMTAPAAGGIPPFGQDMNGILNQVTSLLAFMNGGQVFPFDGTFATAIGGYVAGAIVARADGTGFWLNLTNGNTNDPDATGTGWAAVNNYGYGSVSVAASNVTLSPTVAARPVLVISGTLTANVAVIVPATLQSWLVVNNTTGAFSLTVRTAAGSGVIVPAGGFGAPTGVYGDGTNVYPSFSPLTVPIDQAATPSTLVERTSAGYALATYFNQSSAIETPAIGAVFVQNTAADGFLRKISLAGFIAQLPPGLVTRTVSGTETTYSFGTAFIVKIGTVAHTVGGAQVHSFATAFPTVCDGVVPQVANSTGVEFFSLTSAATTRTGFTSYANNTCTVTYIAIGR